MGGQLVSPEQDPGRPRPQQIRVFVRLSCPPSPQSRPHVPTPFQNRCPFTPAYKASCLQPRALKRERTSPKHREVPGSPTLPPPTDNVLGSRGWAAACPSWRALPTSARVSTTARGACADRQLLQALLTVPFCPSVGLHDGRGVSLIPTGRSHSHVSPHPRPTNSLAGPSWRQLTPQRGCTPQHESTAETQVLTPGSWQWAGTKGDRAAFPKQALQSSCL